MCRPKWFSTTHIDGYISSSERDRSFDPDCRPKLPIYFRQTTASTIKKYSITQPYNIVSCTTHFPTPKTVCNSAGLYWKGTGWRTPVMLGNRRSIICLLAVRANIHLKCCGIEFIINPLRNMLTCWLRTCSDCELLRFWAAVHIINAWQLVGDDRGMLAVSCAPKFGPICVTTHHWWRKISWSKYTSLSETAAVVEFVSQSREIG